MRNERVRGNYPSIENEQVTVTLIIIGLSARPNMQKIVPTLMLRRPEANKDLKKPSWPYSSLYRERSLWNKHRYNPITLYG